MLRLSGDTAAQVAPHTLLANNTTSRSGQGLTNLKLDSHLARADSHPTQADAAVSASSSAALSSIDSEANSAGSCSVLRALAIGAVTTGC